ncbi:phosphate-starvation-inducible PsiE family protein [Thermodesulfobacteriota bacterium]
MKLVDIVEKFESFIFAALTVLMMFVVLFAMLDLVYFLLKYLMTPPLGLVEIDQLLEIFGVLLLILIGMELLDTIHTFRHERIIRVEIAVVIGILAVARKVIILNYKSLTSFTLLEVGAAVVGFAVAYYLLRQSRRRRRKPAESDAHPPGVSPY